MYTVYISFVIKYIFYYSSILFTGEIYKFHHLYFADFFSCNFIFIFNFIIYLTYVHLEKNYSIFIYSWLEQKHVYIDQ